MRAALCLLLCAALAGAVPNLLPGDPRLDDPDHHHHHHGDHAHGEHDGEHGDHGDHAHGEHHGEHDGEHGDHGEHGAGEHGHHDSEAGGSGAASSVSSVTVDYGAGIKLTPRRQGHVGHYNPFLPSYRGAASAARVSTFRQSSGFGNQQRFPQSSGFGSQQRFPQQQFQQQQFFQLRPFIPIRPEDLNRNPGTGSSGPKGPLITTCAAGLVCVPESHCDPYTGFIVGSLGRVSDPSLPTVAIQRCQLAGAGGVCCQQKPRQVFASGANLVAGQRAPLRSVPGRQKASYASNPFLSGAFPSSPAAVGQTPTRTTLGQTPRPGGAAQTGQQVVCQGGRQCVEVNRCGADGYITSNAGLGSRSPTLSTFCITAFNGRGVCCLPRPPQTSRPARPPVVPQLGLGSPQDLAPPPAAAPAASVGYGPAPADGSCGQSRNIGVTPGAGEAGYGELPWQAIIYYSNYTFICGGSLVSDRHIVTAAHCLQYIKPEEILVRLGEYQLNTNSEPYPYQDIGVSKIHLNKEFRQGPLFNDVAVLELRTPAVFGAQVGPICLPQPGQTFSGRCLAAGWTQFAFDGGFAAKLKKVDLPMVSNDVCQSSLKKTGLGSFFKLDKSFVCAGGEGGIDACKGDGGGPLACPVDGSYVLAGITSWAVDCGKKDVPAVYASTTSALSFIQRSIGVATSESGGSTIQRGNQLQGSASYNG